MSDRRLKLLQLQHRLQKILLQAAADEFSIALDTLVAEVPPRTEMGDLAFPVAFELAKRIKAATGEKMAPRAIAERLRSALAADTAVVKRVEVAGAGYLNVYYDRAAFLTSPADAAFLTSPADSDTIKDVANSAAEPASTSRSAKQKRIVEHTNINPNKAAHIGHLRNAVLGDSFVRILRRAGETVEVQNYIDNTGVQVADVVVGFEHIEHLTLDDVRALDESLPLERPFDYYCWDLYAQVGLFYRNAQPDGKEDQARLRLREQTLHLIEQGGNPTAELAEYVATRVVNRHLDTMLRLGIKYDVLPRESEILLLHFWDQAFARLKEAGAIRLETDGRNAGCWVMPLDAHHSSSSSSSSTDDHEADKIIVRSNGTVTYAGKDIAYQLWKLGELGLDFYYKPFRVYEDGQTAWITTSEAALTTDDVAKETHSSNPASPPQFGNGATIYNVIDARQSYTQDVVRRGVAAVAPEAGAEKMSVHLAYEMVALSPAACMDLGIELSAEDQARAHIEMSGRRGLGVKADDLIDRLEAGALAEVNLRHPALSDDEKRLTAHTIAVGALRYFLLKWTRNSVIAFDFREALSFEGETGPYCQYAAVRANSIFRKLDAQLLTRASNVMREAALEGVNNDYRRRIEEVLEGADGSDLWSLIVLANRLDEVVGQSAQAAEPANLAKYTFQLARAFNLFYHQHRIISEEDTVRQAVLIRIADLARQTLMSALDTLGIAVPERM